MRSRRWQPWKDTLAASAVLCVAGLLVAPTTATTYELIDVVASKGRATEAFGWTVATFTAGSALGAWIAGVLARADRLSSALPLPALFVCAGLLLVALRRR